MQRVKIETMTTSILRLASVAALSLLFSGCASSDYIEDPVERAKQITRYEREAGEIMAGLAGKTSSTNPERDLDDLIDEIEEARDLYERAVKLAPEAHKPRYLLGSCYQFMGFEYLFDHNTIERELTAMSERGQRPSPRLTERKGQLWENVKESLGASNREFRFYERFIHGRYPNAGIFDNMRISHEILGEWEEAIEAGRKYLAEATNLSEVDRKNAERVLRLYEERMMEDPGF